ncbi:hypothetical protein [Streptacidiphilus jiangxiensis]|uniref:Secreted protein n=1 Tax=Streptacidiphilus jiangxiensis TaxID=235985 RepID=A0A1H7VZE6_STRJI|nr:hypothetical protein [Streptacidiphilus jiangxiensis]SEM14239.1 hypothetical protein SAMN05414137_11987 [Streptacidiphilus jiangxiensis]
MPNRSVRRARTVALTGLTAAVLSATLLSGTAYAKSGTYVVVGARALRIGQSVQVTAYGGDDSARYTYACLDERVGNGGWFALGCSGQPWASYGRTVRASSFGRIQFRARLLARNSPHGSAWLDRISNPVDVVVH